MESVKLETVYRSSDEAHLIFLNSIRFKQPSREELLQYFGDRHWSRRVDLQTCVARGMEIVREKGEPFTWLTCTNAGASEVCEAALATMGISKLDISGGYLCDPSSKSDLRILARPGIVVRLTRNFDKSRGFVNGALGVVCESLRGNAVFTARLVGTGNMVLVHPMEEAGDKLCNFSI